MPNRKYQPARDALYRERWSVSQAALRMGLPYSHLRAAIMGVAAPSPELRERLPRLLGVPLEDLFEPWLLRRQYSGHRNQYALRSSADAS